MSMGNVDVVVTDIAGPSKTDRDLIVVLYVKNWGQGATSIAYRQPLKLPEGTATVQLVIPFTATQAQLAWDVAIFEDGRDIEDTRNRKSNLNQQDFQWAFNSNQNSGYIPIAGLQASATDANQRSAKLQTINDYIQAQIQQAKSGSPQIAPPAGTMVSPTILTPVNQASSDWRHYLPYPVWIASVEALTEVYESQPQVAEALRTYLSAGGMLAIYDAHTPEAIDTVNKLLRIDDPADISQWRIYDGTMPLVLSLAAESATASKVYDGNLAEPREIADHGHILATVSKVYAGNLAKQKIMERQYARGTVLVANKSLSELLESHGTGFMGYNTAKSISTLTAAASDGNWFWQNLILEVGKPPVLVFCIMVTLFGAVIGPGLLYFTGRMQRRSLMIFLVPAVSFVATLAIVLYGALHEGFETYVRIHSVTVYDAPSQVAFGWSRQNYFSGLPPRQGLQFPVDAYVRPVFAEDAVRNSGDPNPRTGLSGTVNIGALQTWNDWLRPRQHQQLLVGHRVEPGTIPIATKPGVLGGLLLTNLTDVQLPLVALRGAGDDYYVTTDLGPKKTIELLPQDRDSMAVIVGRVGADFKPMVPVELAGGGDSLMNFGNARRYARTYQTQADIIGEAFKIFLSGDIELQPYAFATLVSQSEAITVPLEGTQADNVNLVIGVEPW